MFKSGLKITILKKSWNTLQHYKISLLMFSIMVLALILVSSLKYWQVPIIACPFRLITGYPCPGCGGIRAVQAILNGNILLALQINPLSCLLSIFIVIMLFWSLYDGYKKQNTLIPFLRQKWNKHIMLICIIIILANWIWNIYKHI